MVRLREGRLYLKDISFVIEPGEKVAFVGATGAGKSSILNLIGRYFDIQKGEILIDGVNIKDIDTDVLRAAIGQVQQDVFIFTGDIKSNISLDNENISIEDVKRAAEIVHADSFIEKMPGGYDAPVTERGSTLSAGQRQLLSFARTLAYDPTILVLDEATANIDTETEALITSALAKLMEAELRSWLHTDFPRSSMPTRSLSCIRDRSRKPAPIRNFSPRTDCTGNCTICSLWKRSSSIFVTTVYMSAPGA